ncbi:hypothetical protein EBR57_06540, partial [bacterium]|nr:hypothetical protein [bacterium]
YGRSGLCLSLPFLANYGFFVKTQFYRNNCALLLSILIIFFILDIPIHILSIFSAQKGLSWNRSVLEWYLALMSLIGLYYFSRVVLPESIQKFGETRFGRIIKTIFWISTIAFFY